MGGTWEIEVEKTGEYLIRLSRWPFYMDRPCRLLALRRRLAACRSIRQALPIKSGSSELDERTDLAVPNASDTFVEMRSNCQRATSLQGWFHGAQGKAIRRFLRKSDIPVVAHDSNKKKENVCFDTDLFPCLPALAGNVFIAHSLLITKVRRQRLSKCQT